MFSAWNIGEVLGALDERRQRRQLTQDEVSSAILNLSDETLRTTRQGSTEVLPVLGKILTASWRILQQEHIYVADALQIASAKEATCDLFVTADRRLLETARSQGLDSMEPARDEKKLITL